PMGDERSSRDRNPDGACQRYPQGLVKWFPVGHAAGPSEPSQLISHGIPNRSTTMPKRAAQNVFSSGVTIRPFLANSLKTRSASDVSFIWSESENPFGSS